MVGVYNMTTDPQKLPRWVVPLGNWAWDALTEETPLTDGPLTLEGYQVRWFVQQTLTRTASRTWRSVSGRAERRPARSSELDSVGARRVCSRSRLPGTRKLITECALEVGTARTECARLRRPHARTRTMRASIAGCSSATSSCTASPSASTPGRHLPEPAGSPVELVTPAEVDRLLGAVAETADSSFNTILELGFAESIRREWAWRRSRGESTANLAAFTHLDPGPTD